jgi:hypothetical protein
LIKKKIKKVEPKKFEDYRKKLKKEIKENKTKFGVESLTKKIKFEVDKTKIKNCYIL